MEGGKGGLTGDQWPKGLSEAEVRVIAREEAANALAALAEEVTNSSVSDRMEDVVALAEKKMRPETERL